ncbi:MAG: hypothetical protein R3199_01745 [Gemmatimonadota bacterium]|nr:hypothetical protein [Gemmatimonadota bacterium]
MSGVDPERDPRAVEATARALADWISTFPMSGELGAAMAEACDAGAPWPAGVAATAARAAGWRDEETMAWAIGVGALAGALEAARASLEHGSGIAGSEPDSTADGPARELLAADGLIAAAHEALSSLDPERLEVALRAVEEEFGDGGPWRALDVDRPRPGWPWLVAVAVGPAAADPVGPWAEVRAAWRSAYPAGSGEPRPADLETLAGPLALEESARALLRAAAEAASRPAER